MLAPVKGSCTKPGGGQVQVSVMLVVETWGQAGGGKKKQGICCAWRRCSGAGAKKAVRLSLRGVWVPLLRPS
jgi:hypothetical protein